MPWLETSPMDQRKQFIVDYHRGLQSVTELADRFGISRKHRVQMDRTPRCGGGRRFGGSQPTPALVSA